MVERTITATIATYPDCGVAMWAPRRLREIPGFQMTAQRLDDDLEPIDKAVAVALKEIATGIARDVANEQARGVKALILSEENLMGSMRTNFRKRRFYPDVAHRLAAFGSVLPMSPKVVALGVRDYGAVWTSAFHYLPQAGKAVPSAERVRPVLLEDKRGWVDVVKGVQGVWPDCETLMWRQEDLAENTRQICAAVSGLDPDMIVVPEGKINARKRKTPRPDVFSDVEREQLSQRYKRDIERLTDVPYVRWAAS